MIYLFNACGPLQQCLGECKFSCGNWFNKPLGPYVIIGMVLSGVEAAHCILALLDAGLPQCEGITPNAKWVGVEHWLLIEFALASVNFMFCPYIQFRLWQNLQLEASQIEMEEHQGPGAMEKFSQPDAWVDVPRDAIRDAFWNVFMYDFGVCGYVFALFGSGFWSLLGTRWFDGQAFCNPSGYVSTVIWLGDGFVIFVCMYFFGFLFYMRCVNSIDVNPASKMLLAAGTSGAYAVVAQQAVAHGMPAHAVPLQGQRGKNGAQVQQGRPMQQGKSGKKWGMNMNSGSRPSAMTNQQSAPTSAMTNQPTVTKRTPMQRAMHPAMIVKLVACLGLDAMGDATYFLPGLGETFDLAWAPAQALAMKMMFRYAALPALGFTEEILPGTDILPSATLGWLLEVCAPDNGCTRAIGIRSDYSP